MKNYKEIMDLLGDDFRVDYVGVFTLYYKDTKVTTLVTEEEVKSFLLGFDFYKSLINFSASLEEHKKTKASKD